jgi:hypothetical protein
MYDELRNCSLANPLQLSETFEDVHLARKHSQDEETRYSGDYAGMIPRQMLPSEAGVKVFRHLRARYCVRLIRMDCFN